MSDAATPSPAPAAPSAKPKIGVGSMVNHPAFGSGKVIAYEADSYVVIFKNHEVKRVGFGFEAMKPEKGSGDPEYDRVRQAMREVLGDYGFIDTEIEMGKRWVGGSLKMIPGKEDTQPKEVPLDMFFKKIIGIRDKLRVLEQKVNAHPKLTPEDKVELEGYITRCYGSLTTFNVLFADKESQFTGQSEKE